LNIEYVRKRITHTYSPSLMTTLREKRKPLVKHYGTLRQGIYLNQQDYGEK